MSPYKKHRVYVPSVGVKHALNASVQNKDFLDFYTLSFVPEKSIVSVEEPNHRASSTKPYSLKDFLVIIEDFVAGERQHAPQKRNEMEQDLKQAKRWVTAPHLGWRKNYRKARIAQRIPISNYTNITTVPVDSPLEPKVVEQPDTLDIVHTLHLLPPQLSINPPQPQSQHDQEMFDKMTSAEMHEYFSKKMAENKQFQHSGFTISRGNETIRKNFQEYPVIGNQDAVNPDSEVYDTDSVIEKDDDENM